MHNRIPARPPDVPPRTNQLPQPSPFFPHLSRMINNHGPESGKRTGVVQRQVRLTHPVRPRRERDPIYRRLGVCQKTSLLLF